MDDFLSSSFFWFTGVVEDVDDPLKMNRVKVRVFGLHTQKLEMIPTADLPWATVMMPTTTPGISGLGDSPHFIVKGSWVIGFFRDSHTAQDPIIMGTIASKFMEAPASGQGFADPTGTYPKEHYLEQSDVHRLARGEPEDTDIVKLKTDSVTKGIATATGASWDEPATPYNAVYPFNHVYEGESGHVTEIDDTEGAERIHEYHKSGTFKEIHPDGSTVTRVVKDNYEIVYGDDYVNIKGNVKLTVDANCETYIKGNWDIKVDGNVTETIGGAIVQTVGKDVTKSIAGKRSTNISGSETRSSGGNMADNAPRIDHN